MSIIFPRRKFSIFSLKSLNFKKYNNRPKMRVPLTIFDLVMEIAGLVGLLAMWIIIIASFSKLPDTIPTHFNGAGQPNGFGGKSGIFMLPALATIMFIGFSVLSRFPWIFNYMVKITEHNAFMQYKNATKMMRNLKLSLVIVFGLSAYQSMQVALGNAADIGSWFIVIILAVVIIPVIYFVVMSYKYK
jgi:uncharacterized membrane protein